MPGVSSQDELFPIFSVSYLGFGIPDLFSIRAVIDLMVWFEILEEIWFHVECYRFAPNSKSGPATKFCVIVIL